MIVTTALLLCMVGCKKRDEPPAVSGALAVASAQPAASSTAEPVGLPAPENMTAPASTVNGGTYKKLLSELERKYR
jgi:hypothetical protein